MIGLYRKVDQKRNGAGARKQRHGQRRKGDVLFMQGLFLYFPADVFFMRCIEELKPRPGNDDAPRNFQGVDGNTEKFQHIVADEKRNDADDEHV